MGEEQKLHQRRNIDRAHCLGSDSVTVVVGGGNDVTVAAGGEDIVGGVIG